jgi:hypothetical protein
MAATFRWGIAVPAAGLALAALAACGGGAGAGANAGAVTNTAAADAAIAEGERAASMLLPDHFRGVCSGAPVSGAAAYDPRGTAHKALYFATYRDDFMDQSSTLPRDWTVLFSADHDALRAIDLVVCARRTAAREVKVCDGYQSNGAPTQNRVRWHTATYELSVREAKTGRQLGATTTVEASDAQCPSFMSFQGDSETVDGYASVPNATVADFLRPHITH